MRLSDVCAKQRTTIDKKHEKESFFKCNLFQSIFEDDKGLVTKIWKWIYNDVLHQIHFLEQSKCGFGMQIMCGLASKFIEWLDSWLIDCFIHQKSDFNGQLVYLE